MSKSGDGDSNSSDKGKSQGIDFTKEKVASSAETTPKSGLSRALEGDSPMFKRINHDVKKESQLDADSGYIQDIEDSTFFSAGSNFSKDSREREARRALELMDQNTTPKLSSTNNPADIDGELDVDGLNLHDASDSGDEFSVMFDFEEESKTEDRPATNSSSSTAQCVNGDKDTSHKK
jgi:hypothetical protein